MARQGAIGLALPVASALLGDGDQVFVLMGLPKEALDIVISTWPRYYIKPRESTPLATHPHKP
jgi:hypothetical protein